MGCGGYNMQKNVPQSWMELFAAMRLTKSEVRQLYNIFKKVDVDNSENVDIVELLTLLDIERTHFTEQVFTVFDSDNSGKVDFKEFVLAVWNYCTISQASLDIFTFDMYDRDKSGKLSLEEVHKMLRDIYGKAHLNDPKVRAIEQELEKINEKSGITLEALKKFAKNHQNLLYPVFKLQHHLQENVLGVSFWQHASERRVQLSKGKYCSMADLLLLHMDADLYRRVMSDASKVNPRVQAIMNNTGTAQNRQGRNAAPAASEHPIILSAPPTDHYGSTRGGPPHGGSHGGANHHGTSAKPGSVKNHEHGHDGHHGHDSGHHSHDSGSHRYDGGHHGHEDAHHGHDGSHHHHHHHHKGAVLKNVSDHGSASAHGVHATGHHYSDGKVYAEH